MPTVESLIAELNELCKCYVSQKEDFNEHESIRELLTEIEKQGFEIAIPVIELNTPEYNLLSEDGKMDFEKMIIIRKMKLEAIRKMKFERVATLRERERLLENLLSMDFFINNGKNYFILIDKLPKIVIINDPERHLRGMFKKPY